jgi:hypothetical protein
MSRVFYRITRRSGTEIRVSELDGRIQVAEWVKCGLDWKTTGRPLLMSPTEAFQLTSGLDEAIEKLDPKRRMVG